MPEANLEVPVVDLYVGVDLVCVRLEVSSGRSRRGGGELLLFGGESLALRSRRALLGLGRLTVSLEVADLGEIPRVACLATTRRNPGFLAPLRCERENRYRNNDNDNNDGYSKHLRLPFVWAKKPGSGARSRERYDANVHPVIDNRFGDERRPSLDVREPFPQSTPQRPYPLLHLGLPQGVVPFRCHGRVSDAPRLDASAPRSNEGFTVSASKVTPRDQPVRYAGL